MSVDGKRDWLISMRHPQKVSILLYYLLSLACLLAGDVAPAFGDLLMLGHCFRIGDLLRIAVLLAPPSVNAAFTKCVPRFIERLTHGFRIVDAVLDQLSIAVPHVAGRIVAKYLCVPGTHVASLA